MKDTNAIEKALKDKCEKEISKVIDVFMNELETKIRSKYNEPNYYEFTSPNRSDTYNFHTMGTEQLRAVLFRMISNAHIDAMVKVKSKELIKKLELI